MTVGDNCWPFFAITKGRIFEESEGMGNNLSVEVKRFAVERLTIGLGNGNSPPTKRWQAMRTEELSRC